MNNLNLVNCEDIDDDLLAQFRHAASRLAERLQTYRRHIADMQFEFERIATERDEWKRDAGKLAESSVKAAQVIRTRETIDGVECERIQGLDVIVPVGLIPDREEPKEVRSHALKCDSRWIGGAGHVAGETTCVNDAVPGRLAILLADKPAPAPVPTWTPPASFADGGYVINRGGALLPSGTWVSDEVLQDLSRGLYEKPALGHWRVESGMGIYLGTNEATQ